jgi:hypothetical protein
MKKPKNPRNSTAVNALLSVRATLLETGMLQDLVEELAHRKSDIGYRFEQVPTGSQAIDTSTIEAYVSGELFFSNTSEPLNVPFDTNFLFTCIKGNCREYSLTWVSSLS